MTGQNRILNGLRGAILLSALLLATSCRSYHVEITVENHSGAAIQLLEVDYPSASFGADSLAAGTDMHYRIQIRGAGQLTLQYSAGDAGNRRIIHISGPKLSEREQGSLQIMLLPGGKATFSQDFALSH